MTLRGTPVGARSPARAEAEARPTCLAQSSLLRLRPSCSSSRSRLMLSRSFCSCRPCHRPWPQSQPPGEHSLLTMDLASQWVVPSPAQSLEPKAQELTLTLLFPPLFTSNPRAGPASLPAKQIPNLPTSLHLCYHLLVLVTSFKPTGHFSCYLFPDCGPVLYRAPSDLLKV